MSHWKVSNADERILPLFFSDKFHLSKLLSRWLYKPRSSISQFSFSDFVFSDFWWYLFWKNFLLCWWYTKNVISFFVSAYFLNTKRKLFQSCFSISPQLQTKFGFENDWQKRASRVAVTLRWHEETLPSLSSVILKWIMTKERDETQTQTHYSDKKKE